jgi:hypothetical protein
VDGGGHLEDMTSPLVALSLLLTASAPVGVRWPPGTLHGFPSLSDESGALIADGELAQELRGETLLVHLRWLFDDGRRVEERDVFRAGAHLAQTRFSWTERSGERVLRHFEVDFSTGHALTVTHDDGGDLRRDEERLDLSAGPAFAGYGAALAVGQLALPEGTEAEVVFVAFTPKPRVVTLGVRRDGEDRIGAAGRLIPCDRITLHPKIPFPLSLFAGAKDGHLWFTRDPPPALVRAEQALMAKDDPTVVVDVIPRARVRPPGARRTATGAAGRAP